MATLERVIARAQEVGQLPREVDAAQLAFELQGIMLAYNYESRLLRDAHARERAFTAFERIVAGARARS
jgi:hypothetical protein